MVGMAFLTRPARTFASRFTKANLRIWPRENSRSYRKRFAGLQSHLKVIRKPLPLWQFGTEATEDPANDGLQFMESCDEELASVRVRFILCGALVLADHRE